MLIRNKETGKTIEVMKGTRYATTAYEEVKKHKSEPAAKNQATSSASKKNVKKTKSATKQSSAASKPKSTDTNVASDTDNPTE